MSTSSCRIKIVKNGEEFEFEGDKKFVFDMLDKFGLSENEKKGQIDKSSKTPKDPVKNTLNNKLVSVGEFIRLIGVKKHTDIVLSFGYYLETYSGLKEFAPTDINTCYYEAKMETSNTSQMIIQNIKRGFMMKAKGKSNLYTLTNSGVQYIEKVLNK